MGAPAQPMERAEAYAESILEGKVLPSQELLRIMRERLNPRDAYRDITGQNPDAITEAQLAHMERDLATFRAQVEDIITRDMETLKAWLAMAWFVGHAAAIEDVYSGRARGRR